MKVRSIALIVCEEFGLAPEKIFSRDRWRYLSARPRQVVCWLTRKTTNRSYTQIARVFGLDGSGARKGQQRLKRYMAADPALKAKVERCMARIA